MWSDEDFFIGFVLPVFVGGGLAALALFWGVPWLWGVIKPWLHTVTGA